MTQQEALEILKMGHNVYLTGAAGTGKTYLLNEYIRFLRRHKVRVGITASTGIAATHLNGMTIHSWSGIGIKESLDKDELRALSKNKHSVRRLQQTKVLVIDEVSMLHAHVLDLVDQVLRAARGDFRPFGGVQVVLCGDFFQLPPVRKGTGAVRLASSSIAWTTADLKICYLHEQYRQADKAYLSVLNAIRSNAVGEGTIRLLRTRYRVPIPSTKFLTRLYTHNSGVDEVNLQELKNIAGEEAQFIMQSSGVASLVKDLKKNCLAPEILTLKLGARVIFLRNNLERGYVNGTMGTVVNFSEDGLPIVEILDGRKIIAIPERWSIEISEKTVAEIRQIPLRLAWAITVHKSQGMTLDGAEVDLSRSFEHGMGYVALSRVRSLNGLRLLGWNPLALKVNPEVISLDATLQTKSEQVAQELATLALHAREQRKKTFLKTISDEPIESKAYSVSYIRQTFPNAYQEWSPESEAELIARFNEGKTIRELSNLFGRKTGGIESRLRKLGLIV